MDRTPVIADLGPSDYPESLDPVTLVEYLRG